MAECDEPSWLAALSLMNSGMEADDGSNKTFFAIMGSINRLAGQTACKVWIAVSSPEPALNWVFLPQSPFHGNISRHDEESSIHIALHPSMKTAEDSVFRLPLCSRTHRDQFVGIVWLFHS